MVARKVIPKWTTVRIKSELFKEVERALEYDDVKKIGISTVSHFVTNSVAKYLQEMKQESMTHVNMHDNHIKIMDRDLEKHGRIVSVYFQCPNTPYCDYCEKDDCIHVQFAWEIPEARRILERHGLRPPPSRTP